MFFYDYVHLYNSYADPTKASDQIRVERKFT